MKNYFKDFVFVKKKGEYLRITKSEILILEADGDYVRIHTTDELYVARMTLTKVEKMLADEAFMKIHRSYSIRLDKIEAINFQEGSITINGRSLPLNAGSRKKLKELINILE